MPCNTCNHPKAQPIDSEKPNKVLPQTTSILPDAKQNRVKQKITNSIKTPFSNRTVPENNLATAKIFGGIFADMKNNQPSPGENTITDEVRKDYRWYISDVDASATLLPVILSWKEKKDSAFVKFILKPGITKKNSVSDLPVTNLQQYTSQQSLVDTVGMLCRNYISGMILVGMSGPSIDGTTNAYDVEYELCQNKADVMRYVSRIQAKQFESLYYSTPGISTIFHS
jgi:hypothetical protein